MSTEIVKLKIKQENQTLRKDKEIEDKFIEACMNLDETIFAPLIDEDQYFEDLDKYRFLQTMKNVFDRARWLKHSSVVPRKGVCTGCQGGHETYEFKGEDMQHVFSYIIIRNDDGFIEDIFQCMYSSGSGFVLWPKDLPF